MTLNETPFFATFFRVVYGYCCVVGCTMSVITQADVVDYEYTVKD
jgi:hypothetical protein